MARLFWSQDLPQVSGRRSQEGKKMYFKMALLFFINFFAISAGQAANLQPLYPFVPSMHLKQDDRIVVCSKRTAHCVEVHTGKTDSGDVWYASWSEDGGVTWKQPVTPPPSPPYSSGSANVANLRMLVCNQGVKKCIAMSSFENVPMEIGFSVFFGFYTEDGGKNWALSRINTPSLAGGYMPVDMACNTAMKHCVMIADGRGYGHYSTVPVSYVSHDGGKIWAESAVPPPAIQKKCDCSPGYCEEAWMDSLSCLPKSTLAYCEARGRYEGAGCIKIPIVYESFDGGNVWSVKSM